MPASPEDEFEPPVHVNEDSVARAFADRQAGALRHCAERRCWYVFDGAVWRRDDTGLVMARVRELSHKLGAAARSADHSPRASSERPAWTTMRFMAGAERLARVDPLLATKADLFDADPFLLGTPDGPVDLRGGARLPADPGQNISRATAVGPAETADCPVWLAFLDETFGDPALVRFLQQFFGYSLTGDTSEQVLLFGHGTGGNGKSLLVRTVAGLMGDYATAVAPGTFTVSRNHHPTEIASLDGARLVTMAETESDGSTAATLGTSWDQTRLKLLTGGDQVTARFLRRDAFTFTPQFKLLVIGNHRPAVARVDEAMRRRFCLLPFERRPATPDRRLAEKLRAEWPGILRWMIEGCLDWQANGLVQPKRVAEATNAYLGSQDVLGQFLDERCHCEPLPTTLSTPSGKLFEAWSSFAREAGAAAGSPRTFAEAMEARGFRRGRTVAHGRFFCGVMLWEA